MKVIGTKTYRLTGITEILGSQPADPEIRSRFIASKAPTTALGAGEEDMVDSSEDEIERGLTKFFQSAETGALGLLDYQVKGHIKEAMVNTSATNGVKQAASKVDNYLFIEPREIGFKRNGEWVEVPDGVNERPLKAMTMRGPRIGLAASEQIDAPWQIEFSVTILPNSGSKVSAPVTFEALEAALDYGYYKGIGQWRNGGHGRYTWECID